MCFIHKRESRMKLGGRSERQFLFWFVFNVFKACGASLILSSNCPFHRTQVRDVSRRRGSEMPWGFFVCVCVSVWGVWHLFCAVLLKGFWKSLVTLASNISFDVPNEGTGLFMICFNLLFYDETGSRSSGGLETSSVGKKDYISHHSLWHKYSISH